MNIFISKSTVFRKMIPVSQAQKHRILISGFGFNNQGRYGRQRSEIMLPGHASRTIPYLSSTIPKPVLSMSRSPGPGTQPREAGQPIPGPPTPAPFLGSTLALPHPQPRPFLCPLPSPQPWKAESRSARPKTDLAISAHCRLRAQCFHEKLGPIFVSVLLEYMCWEHSIMTKTSIAQIKHND